MLYEKGLWSGANSREEASMSKMSSSWGEFWGHLIIVKAWLELGNDLVVKDKITFILFKARQLLIKQMC